MRAPNFGAMLEAKLSRALATGVLAIALFNTLSGLSQPDHRPPAPWLVVLWAALLVAHAVAYWYSAPLRTRFGDGWYISGQTAVVFALGVTGAFFPVSLALYLALTMYAVVIAGARWGTLSITLAAIVVFALNAIMTSNLYQGSMAGLLLAAAGVVGHAVAAMLRRDSSARTASAPGVAVVPSASPVIPSTFASLSAGSATGQHVDLPQFGLTAREAEILAALTTGARNSEIAAQLGIAERTVKAHLARIYDKLGVDSRAAAIAIAVRAERR